MRLRQKARPSQVDSGKTRRVSLDRSAYTLARAGRGFMTDVGRYEVVDAEHGEGGFGKVQKQRDRMLERFVAVKQQRMLDDVNARERFEREAKALARMNHPNIPAIYDVRFDERDMLIYFAFVEGRSLRNVITEEAIPPLDMAILWFSQVAAALEHAHSQGIVHRDVKPDNIVISTDNENATLVDFGIAMSADDVRSLTREGYVIGTQAYMSPEQARGEDLDGRSDIYSLGITLYEALAGHLPHAGGYQSLSDGNESIAPAIDDLIRDCLLEDREARVQSASEFAKRLKSAVRADQPLSALLTDARLAELVPVLRQLSAEDFASKPRGQKLLLVNRMKDLVRTDRPELRNATADVIALLTRLARFEAEAEYRPVVSAAFFWGYEQSYGPNWTGNSGIRDELIQSAKAATPAAHAVLADEFASFLQARDITQLAGWQAHDLRVMATALLANANCDADADRLAALYDTINEATH